MKCLLHEPANNPAICGGESLLRCPCGREHTRTCDFKVYGGDTCDAPLCDQCAHSPAADKDLCPRHKKLAEARP